MDIELPTQNDRHMLALRNIKNVGGSDFECVASIRSGWLSIQRQFYFGKYYAEEFVQSLKVMQRSLSGSGVLRAEFEDQEIILSCSKLGKVVVSGHFIEHADLEQTVEFAFETDQTVLLPFLQQLERLLEEKNS